MELRHDRQRQGKNDDDHDHAYGACDGIVFVCVYAMSVATRIPEVLDRSALKSHDENVQDHPYQGETHHPTTCSLQPRGRKYPDVQNKNSDDDGAERYVPRDFVKENRLDQAPAVNRLCRTRTGFLNPGGKTDHADVSALLRGSIGHMSPEACPNGHDGEYVGKI